MFRIKKDVTKEELDEMGFSRLAVEFVYSRRGLDLEVILEEAFQKHLPYPLKQNIHTVLVIHSKPSIVDLKSIPNPTIKNAN